MHTCIHAYIRTYLCACIHTYTYTYTYIHTYIHNCIHTCEHTPSHATMHECMHLRVHSSTCMQNIHTANIGLDWTHGAWWLIVKPDRPHIHRFLGRALMQERPKSNIAGLESRPLIRAMRRPSLLPRRLWSANACFHV